MLSNRAKILCSLFALLAMAVVIAGCGDDSDSDNGSAGGDSSADAGAVVQEAEALVEEAKAPITAFNGPASSPPPAKDKTVYVISCSPDTEGCQRDVVAALEAAKEIGWTAKRIDTKGTPEEFVSAMEQAMNAGADGIVGASFPVEAIQQPLKRAESKGVPVVTILAGNEPPEVGADFKGGFFAEVDTDGVLQGEYAAAWLIAQQEGAVKAGVIDTPEFPILGTRMDGFRSKLGECPECEIVQEIAVPVTKIAAEASSATANFLQANPDVNSLFPTYDGIALFAVQAVNQTGKSDQVQLISVDGNKPNLALIEKGDVQHADVVSPHEWDGWAAIDELNRAFNGEAPAMEWQPGGGGIPTKLLDDTNLPPAGQAWTGDIDYKAEFRKLWGIG